MVLTQVPSGAFQCTGTGPALALATPAAQSPVSIIAAPNKTDAAKNIAMPAS